MYKAGKTLDQICKKAKTSRDHIGFLRQLYDIKVQGAKFIHRKKTEVPLTQRQRELIYGSLLGDAKKVSPSAVGFGHGESQKEYLFWKYNEMGKVISKNSLKPCPYTDKRNGHKGVTWRCYTHANTEIEEIISQFYGSGIKEVSDEILNELSPFSIAVWYMDDGSTDLQKRFSQWNVTPCLSLCTDSFSLESCERISQWFKDKWQINNHLRNRGIRKDGGEKIRVIFNADTAYDLIDLMKPHIIPLFNYKIGITT